MRSALAASVSPDEVMSTMRSAVPEAGAASVAPALSTMRYSAMPHSAKKLRVRWTYLVATRSQRPWRQPEIGGDVGEVDHVGDVDPGVGHGDDDIGLAEVERLDENDVVLAVLGRLVDEVGAGDADVDGADDQLAGDLGGRIEAHR